MTSAGNLLARYLNEHGFYFSTYQDNEFYRLSIDKNRIRLLIEVTDKEILIFLGSQYNRTDFQLKVNLHEPTAFEEVLNFLLMNFLYEHKNNSQI